MYMGHDKEAKALYLAHKRKLSRSWMSYGSKPSLRTLRFRKAGLTHPMMADIEKELGDSR